MSECAGTCRHRMVALKACDAGADAARMQTTEVDAMSKKNTGSGHGAVLVPPRPTWKNTLESLADSVLRPGYKKMHSTEIDCAGDWRTCAVGERLGFPEIDGDVLAEIILQTDDGLYGTGCAFASAVNDGDMEDALRYHGEINSADYDGSIDDVMAKVDLMRKVHGDRMPAAVASQLVMEFDDPEVFADTVCDDCGRTHLNVEVGVPDPETYDLVACDACGGDMHAENVSVLAYDRTYRLED